MAHYANWTLYRYGSKPKAIPPRIFTGKRRLNAIERVMIGLERWRLSPFEREGECRNGIRATLCLQGHGWDAADAAASDLVSEALRRIGAERPSWQEGQWFYTTPREQCARCGRDVDDVDQARGFRHCSPECARAHKLFMSGQVPASHALRAAASWQDRLAGTPTIECRHCAKPFKFRVRGSSRERYCSLECNYAARGLPLPPCAWCGQPFVPSRRKTRCCSLTCANFLRVKAYRQTAPELTCPVCQTKFRARSERNLYCGDACHRVARRAQERARYRAKGFHCEAAE